MTRRNLIALGIACLVVSSVTDAIRAPLLPLLAKQYALDYGALSYFLIGGGLAACAFNLASVRLLEFWSDRTYLWVVAALQGVSILGAAAGRGGWGGLLFWGVLWGAGNSGLGLAANLFVISGSEGPSRSRALSLLHLFYGFSCMLPALFVAKALDWGWGLAAILAPGAAACAAVGAAGFGAPIVEAPADEAGPRPPWGLDVAAVCAAVSFYVLGEVMTSMWLVSYLHAERGLSIAAASVGLAGFFVGLSLGRAALAWRHRGGQARGLPFIALAAALGLGLWATHGPVWAFAAAGFAMGPFYPLMMSTISLEYPRDYRAVLSAVYTCMTLGLAAGHGVMGWVADRWSLQAAFHLPAAFFALAAASLALFWKRRAVGRLPWKPPWAPATINRPPTLSR